MTPETFEQVVAVLGRQGEDDIKWSENCGPPETADEFAREAIFVICNSGTKNTVAQIPDRPVSDFGLILHRQDPRPRPGFPAARARAAGFIRRRLWNGVKFS